MLARLLPSPAPLAQTFSSRRLWSRNSRVERPSSLPDTHSRTYTRLVVAREGRRRNLRVMPHHGEFSCGFLLWRIASDDFLTRSPLSLDVSRAALLRTRCRGRHQQLFRPIVALSSHGVCLSSWARDREKERGRDRGMTKRERERKRGDGDLCFARNFSPRLRSPKTTSQPSDPIDLVARSHVFV